MGRSPSHTLNFKDITDFETHHYLCSTKREHYVIILPPNLKEVKLGRGRESISEFMKFSTISLNSQENSNGIGITIPILQKKKLSAQRGDVNSLRSLRGQAMKPELGAWTHF